MGRLSRTPFTIASLQPMAIPEPVSKPLAQVVHVPCGICGQEEGEIVQLSLYRMGDQHFPLVQCQNCGLAYVNPRPRLESHRELLETAEFFDHGYAQGVREQSYFDRRDLWLDEYDRELERLEAEVGYVGRLLEYGSGGGFFTEAARRRGWQVQAVEPGKTAADYAEVQFPIPVYRGELGDAPFEEGAFDVVVLNESLPYSPEPLELVRELFYFTRPGGHLFMTLPSYVNSGLHRTLVKGERMIPRKLLGPELTQALKVDQSAEAGPPYQLQHFNKRAVLRLLDASGFQVDEIKSSLVKPDHLFQRQNLRLRDWFLRGSFKTAEWMMHAGVLPSARMRVLARRPIR